MQKKYRLSGTRTFNYLYKKGKSVATHQLVLIYAPSKYNLHVGVVASKKVGKAVVRNRVRRRIKEAFRSLIPYIQDNNNYIIVAKQTVAECNFAQIKSSLIKALQRAEKLSVSDISKII